MNYIFRNKNGNEYNFERIDENNIPEKGGLYCLGVRKEKLTPIYIGESKNLHERLTDTTHEGVKCAKKNSANTIVIHITDEQTKGMTEKKAEEYRMSIERELIEHYNPKCNSQHNQ